MTIKNPINKRRKMAAECPSLGLPVQTQTQTETQTQTQTRIRTQTQASTTMQAIA